jgi:hypothetical protein
LLFRVEAIVDADVIDWTPETTFKVLSASVRDPELILYFISRNIIPTHPTLSAARPWLIDKSSGQTLLHLLLASGGQYNCELIDALCRLGLAITDEDSDGNNLWYLPF